MREMYQYKAEKIANYKNMNLISDGAEGGEGSTIRSQIANLIGVKRVFNIFYTHDQ